MKQQPNIPSYYPETFHSFRSYQNISILQNLYFQPGLLGDPGHPVAGPVELVLGSKAGSVKVGPHAGETQ